MLTEHFWRPRSAGQHSKAVSGGVFQWWQQQVLFSCCFCFGGVFVAAIALLTSAACRLLLIAGEDGDEYVEKCVL